ncbi:lipopolysaccharide transport periplasmic protein LptA [Leucothrix mucor]|uniref:lipopolysaccharide transport periplasmic protein LptA n=1 Tax=Leucothrix mucor TaxID=45248 RepID=UPI0003B37313|nr:lipopolysaccharide transport periplasmic protein LptA [Leucothrix mucor]
MYKQIINPLRRMPLILALLIASAPSMALKNDVTQPVRINADNVVFNKSKGLATYSGNVVIIQGSLQLRAWEIVIQAPNNTIRTITAKGNPVQFQQTMDDGKVAKGQARLIRYQVEEKRLFLDGDAELAQNNDKFSSEHIEYSTRTGELKAGLARVEGKRPDPKGRVSAIFYPTNKVK